MKEQRERLLQVNCRIGSLENKTRSSPYEARCKLPNRQFRNYKGEYGQEPWRKLPNRKFRNYMAGVVDLGNRKLPNRQFRKKPPAMGADLEGKLPNRQFRNRKKGRCKV